MPPSGEEGLRLFGDGLPLRRDAARPADAGHGRPGDAPANEAPARRRVHHHGDRLRHYRAGRRRDEARGHRLRAQADDARHAPARGRRRARESDRRRHRRSPATPLESPRRRSPASRVAARNLDDERVLHPSGRAAAGPTRPQQPAQHRFVVTRGEGERSASEVVVVHRSQPRRSGSRGSAGAT